MAEPRKCLAFETSAFLSSLSANSFSQNAIVSSDVIVSSPAFSQFFSGVSTMNVDQSSSNRYACRVNHPHSVSRKSNVKASSFFLVPSQIYRLLRTLMLGLNIPSYFFLVTEETPSA